MTFIPRTPSKPTITREVTIHPTICEVAQAFADTEGREQALFFHEVALVFLSWGRLERDTQLLEIAKKINPQGSAADFIRELHDAIFYPTLGACDHKGIGAPGCATCDPRRVSR